MTSPAPPRRLGYTAAIVSGVTPRVRSLLLGAYATFALLAGTLLIARGLGRIDTVVPNRPVYDLVVDWRGARAFVEGYNPYSEEGRRRAELTTIGNGHPPTTPFWMLPLAPFSLKVAREVLLQFDLLLLLVELAVIVREYRSPGSVADGLVGAGPGAVVRLDRLPVLHRSALPAHRVRLFSGLVQPASGLGGARRPGRRGGLHLEGLPGGAVVAPGAGPPLARVGGGRRPCIWWWRR